MRYDLIIKNGQVITEDGTQQVDVCICDGKIAYVGKCTDQDSWDKEVNAEGQYVFPGFIDPHVHLNDPGLTNSEDFYTGTCAAAAGGITTVLEHPLTFPLPDHLQSFNEKKEIAKSKAVVNFGLFGACSENNQLEMEKMIENGAIAFKTFLTYSPEIPKLDDGRLLERMSFLSGRDIVLAIHCENNDIVEYCTAKLQAEGRISPEDYPDGRPEIAEIEAVSRMALFAKETGCKVNIAHCTLEEAVDIVQEAKKAGADISVETCPQYLLLNRSMLPKLGVFGICNPPLRREESVEKLWNAIFDGKIDWVCSDHATYTVEEKMAGSDNVFKTPAGVTSVELCYQLFFSEGVIKRGLPVEKFVELSSTNAAKRYRLYPNKGRIAVGADADVVIFDPNEAWHVEDSALKQMIKWSPYQGISVNGKVKKTIVNGVEVYDGADVIGEKGCGTFAQPIERKNR